MKNVLIITSVLISIGSFVNSNESTENSSLWENLTEATLSSANTMWQVTKSGSVSAWKATKSGTDIAWEKTKLGAENACNYRPSNLIGGGATGAAATAGAATAAAGIGAKAAGFYTLTHAATGMTMLGSTAGGVSAAGTVGIMGGTAGVVGTIGSIIMAPATIITGAVVGSATIVFESACYFSIERLDDPAFIMSVLDDLAMHSDKDYFELIKSSDGTYIYVASEVDPNGKVMERNKYSASDLYIENGILKNKDWGPNSKIGKVGYILGELSDNNKD